MTGDNNEVRDLSSSPDCGGAPAKCAAVSAWLSNTSAARLGEASSVKVDREPDAHSIDFDDQLLVRAQSGDQQAFGTMSPIFTDGEKADLFDCQKSRGYRRRASGHIAPSLQASAWLSSNLQVFIVAHDDWNQHGVDDVAQEKNTKGRANRTVE